MQSKLQMEAKLVEQIYIACSHDFLAVKFD